MAKYDHGGGCPCGLQKECDCKVDSKEKPSLFESIKHGSPEHQAWLKEAIRCWEQGLPIPKVLS